MNLKEALEELRKNEKRKFAQTIDLIINLRAIDVKKDQVNIIATLPNKIKDKKVCGFLTAKSPLVKTITEIEFQKYKDKKEMKNLIKNYDFFIAAAPLMPKVAMAFGKSLGPAGKMPSPQLGVLMQENEDQIRKTLDKISTSLKIRMKEPSIKLAVGKEDMADEEIIENVKSIYSAIENVLPQKKDNIRSVLLKLTMSKPIKVEVN